MNAADFVAPEVDPAFRDYIGLETASPRATFPDDPDLHESWLDDGWEPLLRRWIGDAARAGVVEPTALLLATVERTEYGPRPASRTVLGTGLSTAGVSFFTDRVSRKGSQLADMPYAAVTFVWPALGRQVHLRGPVVKLSPEVTAAFWHSRPRTVQVGGWASRESQPIASRAELERAHAEVVERFAEVERLPVQPDWCGYQVRPEEVEFWQRRRLRLHNRIRVELEPGGGVAATKITRLQP